MRHLRTAGVPLAAVLGDAPFVFVVGKGGTGKSSCAAAIALACADAGTPTHLISTDPAHSIGDVFDQALTGEPAPAGCAAGLLLEEFDADAFAERWLARATGPVTSLIEAGTYLDGEDVAGFARLAVPGLDEMMAVLRLVELAGSERRIVVDTAPTGHTLRLLDAGATHAGIAAALRAMADKAAVVASRLARGTVRLAAESIIDEMEAQVESFRNRVLEPATFVLVTRPAVVVEAESQRLAAALAQRRLRLAAVIVNSAAGEAAPEDGGPSGIPAGTALFRVPGLELARGCEGIRTWSRAVRRIEARPQRSQPLQGTAPGETQVAEPAPAAAATLRAEERVGEPVLPWLRAHAPPLLLFAGKGGVGKSTCAAAVALALAGDRDVLLCSTDPAGSLADVLGTASGGDVPRLRVVQVAAEAQLAALREQYRDELLQAMERIGLSEAAVLDRRVIDSLWNLAPPGIDEFAALAALLDAAGGRETVVVDAAPTGHFLRLLTMPDMALDWTRQLMRIIVKYRVAGVAGGAAESLLKSARELRALRELLHDPTRCGVLVVTLPEPVVAAETARLLDALSAGAVPVAAVVCNRDAQCGACRSVSAGGWARICAPGQQSSPVGASALTGFLDQWKVQP